MTMTDPVINSHPDDIDAFVAWLKKRCCSPEQPKYDAHSASVRGFELVASTIAYRVAANNAGSKETPTSTTDPRT